MSKNQEGHVSTPTHQEPQLEGIQRVAVVVAHPDDETLWAGGLLLSHPEWMTFIVTLCRGSDPDRAPRFNQALKHLSAEGRMADLDDGPDQAPLPPGLLRETIAALLPAGEFDLLLTHAPDGEYTRHRRHEEVARAVDALWREHALRAPRLWQFAYHDGGGAFPPRARPDAAWRLPLSDALWKRKHAIITRVYGFTPASWEARVVPHDEAFYCFEDDACFD